MTAADIFIASLLADFARKVVLHPVDTMATRLQYAQTKPFHAKDQLLVGDARAMVDMLQRPGELYRGLGTALVGAVPVAVVYMPTYEFCSQAVRAMPPSDLGIPLPAAQIASIATGLACALVRVPVTLVKSRLQLGLSATPLQAVGAALQAMGLRGLFIGLRATCVLDVVYALVQFSALEQVRAVGAVLSGGRGLTSTEDALVGFLTGATTAVITEPLDVVRTRLQTQRAPGSGAGSVDFGYTGLADGLAKAARQEGLLALWKGLLPRLLLKSVGSAIWYAAYMAARKALAAASGVA